MKDGTSVEADAIITATGLNMKLGGGVELTVDGEAVSWGKRVVWNGAMLDGAPNLMFNARVHGRGMDSALTCQA